MSDYLVIGEVSNLTLLVRSTPLMFPLALLVYLVILERLGNPKVAVFRNITAMSVAMFVVRSPWFIRNYALTNKCFPMAAGKLYGSHPELMAEAPMLCGGDGRSPREISVTGTGGKVEDL